MKKKRSLKIVKTVLTAKNKTKAINTWAVLALTYSVGIIKWSDTDLKSLISNNNPIFKFCSLGTLESLCKPPYCNETMLGAWSCPLQCCNERGIKYPLKSKDSPS